LPACIIWNISFLSSTDLQKIFIFVFLVILGKFLLFRWASFFEWSPCKVSILFGTCFKNIDLHSFMLLQIKCWKLYRVILFYVKNSNTETAAIKVAFFCLKPLRYFFFQNVHCKWDMCPIWSLGSLDTFFLVIIIQKK